MSIKMNQTVTLRIKDDHEISQVDGLGLLVGRGFGGLGASVCAQSGLLRFFEFFFNMHSDLEAPLVHFKGLSNAFNSSMISGLTSITSSA